MAPSDLKVLLDMGFERERAELAVKKSGGRESLQSRCTALHYAAQ